ncbi:hypothetical protein [Flavisolibacter nicotianae]|nr:hypothetical protein [Flavisolibacter nicotianae]
MRPKVAKGEATGAVKKNALRLRFESSRYTSPYFNHLPLNIAGLFASHFQ